MAGMFCYLKYLKAANKQIGLQVPVCLLRRIVRILIMENFQNSNCRAKFLFIWFGLLNFRIKEIHLEREGDKISHYRFLKTKQALWDF